VQRHLVGRVPHALKSGCAASLLAAIGCAFACGAEAPVHREYDFEDALGRACVVVCEDDDCEMDCAVESVRECGESLPRPCFTLATLDEDAGPEALALCDSCCDDDGPLAIWLPEDCEGIECETASDCPPLNGGFRCEGGRCVRP